MCLTQSYIDGHLRQFPIFCSYKQCYSERSCVHLILYMWWGYVCKIVMESLSEKAWAFWGASLVAQWLRIRLPMQGTGVRALVQEDPTCRRATKPVCHNYWACALQPACRNSWSPRAATTGAHALQQEKPLQWEARALQGKPLLTATRESPCTATKTQCSQKLIN